MEIIKYKGNERYIVGLAKNDSKKYIFFANVDGIIMNQEAEELASYGSFIKFIDSKKYTIELLLKLGTDNSFIHFLEIENEKEYELITKFLEIIL